MSIQRQILIDNFLPLQSSEEIIFKKKNVGGFAQPDFKTYLKETFQLLELIQTLMVNKNK